MITFLILAPYIVANTIAAASLAISFTRLRGHAIALVVAIISMACGLFLGLSQGFQASGILPVHVLSWLPLAVGCLALLRWKTARAATTRRA